MSNYYIARVSEAGLEFIRSDFKIPVKADSLPQARAGVNRIVFEIERATDQEIFDIARSGNAVLNLSDVTTDEDQQTLPFIGVDPAAAGQDTTVIVDMTKPSAHDGLTYKDVPLTTNETMLGATKSGSAPGWLQQEVSQTTGD